MLNKMLLYFSCFSICETHNVSSTFIFHLDESEWIAPFCVCDDHSSANCWHVKRKSLFVSRNSLSYRESICAAIMCRRVLRRELVNAFTSAHTKIEMITYRALKDSWICLWEMTWIDKHCQTHTLAANVDSWTSCSKLKSVFITVWNSMGQKWCRDGMFL